MENIYLVIRLKVEWTRIETCSATRLIRSDSANLKNGRKSTAFGVSIISDRNLQAFHYNVVAFGKQGHFAKPLQTGTRIKLVVQAQSQPDNIASIPLLTATFVRPVHPVAVAPSAGV